MIPLCDLKLQYLELQDELDAAMKEVVAAGQYILGPNVRAFEQEMADYCGVEFAVGVGSGTDALHLSLRALGIGPGDEVITTPFTFIGTTEAICMTGAKPVFVDIDPKTLNIDVQGIEVAISANSRAILPVHLYGQPCEMDIISDVATRHGLHVVEDCAQAVGAEYAGQKVGSLGIAGCFSFFPSKNLGCCGDGGMVVTNDAKVYERVEMLRRHGGKVKYHHTELGVNSRLDELQAAILRVKLPHLDQWNAARRQSAYSYNRLLKAFPDIKMPEELDLQGQAVLPADENRSHLSKAVYHQYTILMEDRDAAGDFLKQAGIGNAVYYPVPLHLQEVHRDLNYRLGDFPIAEKACRECLSLPMFPGLSSDQQASVACAFERFFAGDSNSARKNVA